MTKKKIRFEDSSRLKSMSKSSKSLDDEIDDFFADQKPLIKGDKKPDDEVEYVKIAKEYLRVLYKKTLKNIKLLIKNKLAPQLSSLAKKIGPIRLGITAVFSVFIIITILLVSGAKSMNSGSDATKDVLGVSGGSVTVDGSLPQIDKPEFDVLLPAGKTPDQLGGIVRVSPEGNAPVYSFLDKLGQGSLNISQQKVPEQIKSGAQTLEQLAQGFQASNVIEVDGNRIYHGKTDKGVQSMVFIKDGLLILIRSDIVLNDDVWAGYLVGFHK